MLGDYSYDVGNLVQLELVREPICFSLFLAHFCHSLCIRLSMDIFTRIYLAVVTYIKKEQEAVHDAPYPFFSWSELPCESWPKGYIPKDNIYADSAFRKKYEHYQE
jgi:hypothetical protein